MDRKGSNVSAKPLHTAAKVERCQARLLGSYVTIARDYRHIDTTSPVNSLL